MYKLLALALLAACDLQSGGPKPAPSAAPTAPTTTTPTAPTPPPTPVAPADAGPAKVVIEITKPCLDVAIHVAGVIIEGAEPAQRSIFEAERDRIVRSTGEVCTTQAWPDLAIKCYVAAATQPAIKACEAKFPPPQQPQTRQPGPPATQPTGGMHAEPGTPHDAAGSAASPLQPRPPRAGAGSAAAPPRAGAGSGSAR